MEVDKILYNITIRKTKQERDEYIRQIDKQSLEQLKSEIIEKINVFDPEDENSIEEIKFALKAYHELLDNKDFNTFHFDDDSFIMNLGFYIGHQRDSPTLVLALEFIQHQVFDLKESAYFKCVNLIKSLSQIFPYINEKYYQRMVFLMVEMIMNNWQLLQSINNRYDFLECLIQVINKQKQDQIIMDLFGFLKHIYSNKNVKLFHEKDLQVLIEIILRIINDSENQKLIEETLRLYSMLKQNSMLSNQSNKMQQVKQAINDKLGFLDPSSLSQSLKLIIDDTLMQKGKPSQISE